MLKKLLLLLPIPVLLTVIIGQYSVNDENVMTEDDNESVPFIQNQKRELKALTMPSSDLSKPYPKENSVDSKPKAIKKVKRSVNKVEELPTEIEVLEFLIDKGRMSRESNLDDLQKVEKLSLENLTDEELKYIGQIPNLRTLSLRGDSITDVSQLANLMNLSMLQLSGTSISDLSPLVELENLKVLGLTNSNLEFVDDLRKIDSLKVLYLGNTTVEDINSLEGHPNLTVLGLKNTRIEDFSIIESLQNLKTLHVDKDKEKELKAKFPNLKITP